jgi:hypothetical protein
MESVGTRHQYATDIVAKHSKEGESMFFDGGTPARRGENISDAWKGLRSMSGTKKIAAEPKT